MKTSTPHQAVCIFIVICTVSMCHGTEAQNSTSDVGSTENTLTADPTIEASVDISTEEAQTAVLPISESKSIPILKVTTSAITSELITKPDTTLPSITSGPELTTASHVDQNMTTMIEVTATSTKPSTASLSAGGDSKISTNATQKQLTTIPISTTEIPTTTTSIKYTTESHSKSSIAPGKQSRTESTPITKYKNSTRITKMPSISTTVLPSSTTTVKTFRNRTLITTSSTEAFVTTNSIVPSTLKVHEETPQPSEAATKKVEINVMEMNAGQMSNVVTLIISNQEYSTVLWMEKVDVNFRKFMQEILIKHNKQTLTALMDKKQHKRSVKENITENSYDVFYVIPTPIYEKDDFILSIFVKSSWCQDCYVDFETMMEVLKNSSINLNKVACGSVKVILKGVYEPIYTSSSLKVTPTITSFSRYSTQIYLILVGIFICLFINISAFVYLQCRYKRRKYTFNNTYSSAYRSTYAGDEPGINLNSDQDCTKGEVMDDRRSGKAYPDRDYEKWGMPMQKKSEISTQ